LLKAEQRVEEGALLSRYGYCEAIHYEKSECEEGRSQEGGEEVSSEEVEQREPLLAGI
jgi:hypothetical protein